MARTNIKTKRAPIHTHEGAVAVHINPEQQLRRLVLANFLFEDSFYMDGKTLTELIKDAVGAVKPEVAVKTAIEARTKMKLRHVPLLIAAAMARVAAARKYVGDLLVSIIQRPDELGEFLALYRADNPKEKLASQVKKGLAEAITKFDAYQLSKWDKGGAYKLRDVIFLTHPKPKNKGQAEVFAKLCNKTFYPKAIKKQLELGEFAKLAPAETWETKLSAAGETATDAEDFKTKKKEVFEGLTKEKKLGALALLRNLRNMTESGMAQKDMEQAIKTAKYERVLPFRFISAAKHNPKLEDALSEAMVGCAAQFEKLPGKTVLLVDVSGSMDGSKVSEKSEIGRMDAACGVAMMAREMCEQVAVYTFSDRCAEIPARRGFALRDAIVHSMPHNSTMTETALAHVYARESYDRIILITDEQSHQSIRAPKGKGYVINVGTDEHGIGYGPWTHIDGFSENVLEYIRLSEAEKD